MTQRKDTSLVFSRRLKSARLAAGLSQFSLGVAAGIDEASASPRINQYERGVHQPDQGTALRIADALGIPVSYLFEPNDQLAEVIRLCSKLTDPDLAKLVGYLHSAIDK